MLDYLLEHTPLIGYLSLYDLSQVRVACSSIKSFIENRTYPNTPYTWVEKCRFYDPQALWEIDGKLASCYRPNKKKWLVIYWSRKLPSIIPLQFWSYFSRLVKGFLTMFKFMQWSQFCQMPLNTPMRKCWEIGMRVEIVGTSMHNHENYPDELKDIDEFVAIGVCIQRSDPVHENICGLNPFSIGWHSDDGGIYMDSLLVDECQKFGSGDKVDVVIDYLGGMILFKKNRSFVNCFELSGEFLSHPLIFTVSSTTSNSLFFKIV